MVLRSGCGRGCGISVLRGGYGGGMLRCGCSEEVLLLGLRVPGWYLDSH